MKSRNYKQNKVAGLRHRVEKEALSKKVLSPADFESMSPEEICRIFHEQEVHQLELETQNEELIRVQRKLDHARKRYFDLYNLAPVGYCTISEQGLIGEANLKTASLLGFGKEILEQQSFISFIQKDDQDIYCLFLKKLFHSGEPQVTDFRMVRTDALTCWIRMQASIATHDSCNEPVVRAILTDITEQKHAEESLKKSHARYHSAYHQIRMLCDNVPDMIWAKDLEKRYTFVNKAICKKLLNAADTDEPIGKTDLFFAERERRRHGDIPDWHTIEEICRDTDAITIDAGTPQQFDVYGNVQGKFLSLDVSKTPLFDASGKIIGVVGSAHDATRTKELEQKLEKSKSRLRSLIQVIPDMIWLKDLNGLYLDCNAMFERFFGAPKKDILGKTDYDFVDQELADFFREHDRKALEAGKPCSNEEMLTFADGGHRALFETIKTPMFDSDDKLLGVLGIARDITERKRMEEALQDSLAEKEVLLREVHHRVKNNMAAIVGLFNLQRQAMNEPTGQAILADLSSRVRAMSLVHEKLYRSKSLTRINFQDYLQSLISHLRTSFGSPNIRCEISATGVEIPLDLAVPCGMIINELVINALKYAFPNTWPETGGNRGEHILVAMNHSDDIFTLSVADNGIGLPSGMDWRKVSSLGLVLVRMFGEHQLGGRFAVDQIGGTRFTLTFSLRNGREADD